MNRSFFLCRKKLMQPQCSFVPSRGKNTGKRCTNSTSDGNSVCHQHYYGSCQNTLNPITLALMKYIHPQQEAYNLVQVLKNCPVKFSYQEAIDKMNTVFRERKEFRGTQVSTECFCIIASRENLNQPNLSQAFLAHRYLCSKDPDKYEEEHWKAIWTSKPMDISLVLAKK